MDVEERHDEHCAVGRCELIGPFDVLHCSREIAVRQWHGFGTACCPGCVQHEGDIIRTGVLEADMAVATELAFLLDLEDYGPAVEVAFCNRSVVFPSRADGGSVFRIGAFGNQNYGGGEVFNVELEFGLLVCGIQRCCDAIRCVSDLLSPLEPQRQMASHLRASRCKDGANEESFRTRVARKRQGTEL